MRQLTELETELVASTCALSRYEATVLASMVFTGLPTTEAHKWGYWFHRQIACDVRRFATVYLDSQYRLLLEATADDDHDSVEDIERHIRWILYHQADPTAPPARG